MTELEPEELVDARAAMQWERRELEQPRWLGAELVVARRPIHVLPALFAVLLALIVALFALTAGVLGALLALSLWIVADRRRIARLRVEPDGSLTLMGRMRIDWSSLRRLELRTVEPPWWSYTRDTGKLAGTTLFVQFQLADGRQIALSRGQLFTRRPWRPVDIYLFQRWLFERAVAAGMRVGVRDATQCILHGRHASERHGLPG